MRTEDVLELYYDASLRQHIVDTAKALTTNKKLQKALVGHAWYMLGETQPQKTIAFYKLFCTGTMRREKDLYIFGEKRLTGKL
jgi:hypothetical protein